MSNSYDTTRQLLSLLAGISNQDEALAEIISDYTKQNIEYQILTTILEECNFLITGAKKYKENIEQILCCKVSTLQEDYENRAKVARLTQEFQQFYSSLQQRVLALESNIRIAKQRTKDNDKMKKQFQFSVLDKKDGEKLVDFLKHDPLETIDEYIARIQNTVEGLGWIKVGTINVKKDSYDINRNVLKIEWIYSWNIIAYEIWVRYPFQSLLPEEYMNMKIDIDRDKVRELCESGKIYPLIMKIKLSNQGIFRNGLKLVADGEVFDVERDFLLDFRQG